MNARTTSGRNRNPKRTKRPSEDCPTDATAAGAWSELRTEWAVVDAEIMPWSAKSGGLIRNHYEPAGAAARTGLQQATAAVRRAAERHPELAARLDRFEERSKMTACYDEAY